METLIFSQDTDEVMTTKCAKLYAEIFKEPPWNESWEVSQILEDMRRQVKNPGFHGLLAREADEVVGFTWGYSVSLPDMREIVGHAGLDFLFKDCHRLFYIDELGVKASQRGRAIGKKLTSALIGMAKTDGNISILLRTNNKAEIARNLYRSLGFEDLLIQDGAYGDRTYWHLSV